MTKQRTFSTVAPKAGDSVFMGFVTNGEGRILAKQAVNPFDKVQAIYEGSRKLKSGQPVYSVRLTSGDLVDVVHDRNKWKVIR